jgi:hypothetical protein
MDFKTLCESSGLFPMKTDQLLFDRPSTSHVLAHFDTTEGPIGLKSVAVMEPIPKRLTPEQSLDVRRVQDLPTWQWFTSPGY